MSDKVFVEGFNFRDTSKAPDFVKASFGVKLNDFWEWCKTHKDENGWVNIDIKESKGGKIYAEQNTWKPEKKTPDSGNGSQNVQGPDSGDVPF